MSVLCAACPDSRLARPHTPGTWHVLCSTHALAQQCTAACCRLSQAALASLLSLPAAGHTPSRSSSGPGQARGLSLASAMLALPSTHGQSQGHDPWREPGATPCPSGAAGRAPLAVRFHALGCAGGGAVAGRQHMQRAQQRHALNERHAPIRRRGGLRRQRRRRRPGVGLYHSAHCLRLTRRGASSSAAHTRAE